MSYSIRGFFPQLAAARADKFRAGRAGLKKNYQKKIARTRPGWKKIARSGSVWAEKLLFGPGRAGRENVLGQATEEKKLQ